MRIISQSVLNRNASKFIKNELSFQGTQIISDNRDEQTKTLNIVAVGNIIPQQELDKAQKMLGEYSLGGYRLRVIQGSQSDSLLLEQALQSAGTNTKTNKQKLLEQDRHIRALETQLNGYTRYQELSKEIRKEIKAVCPAAKSVILSKVTEAFADTTAAREYVLAVVDCKGNLSRADRQRLSNWLKERVKTDSLRLMIGQ